MFCLITTERKNLETPRDEGGLRKISDISGGREKSCIGISFRENKRRMHDEFNFNFIYNERF